MHPKFNTDPAILERPTEEMGSIIHDFGACTPTQLMLGTDYRLEEDAAYGQPSDRADGNMNPCREDPTYYEWAKQHYALQEGAPWDYAILNDNTRDPARASSRAEALEYLERYWVPLLRESGATPVFLWTHAYQPISTEAHPHDMTGMEDIANFTSLTYAGLKAYVNLLSPLLPANQRPRIAPSGLAFLAVYEQDMQMWQSLFHNADHLHASPSGTFLQGLCVHHTLFGKMPPKESVVQTNMQDFWQTARMMQHDWQPPNPIPTRQEADYLYHIAEQVLVHGYVPATFVNYTHGEVAYEQR